MAGASPIAWNTIDTTTMVTLLATLRMGHLLPPREQGACQVGIGVARRPATRVTTWKGDHAVRGMNLGSQHLAIAMNEPQCSPLLVQVESENTGSVVAVRIPAIVITSIAPS
ncbi:MAG: hypothetical protein IT294_07535 [Deltaproteobacteria bacterium]|nr:hypothetical protein [Deltaproteobacteria bacterium]